MWPSAKTRSAWRANSGMELAEGGQHRGDRLGVGHLAVGADERRVEVVAAEPVEAQPAGLEPEVAAEEVGVLGHHVEQHLDGAVGHVVGEVARRDGRGEPPHLDVLVGPVAHPVHVDLAEDRGLALVHPVDLAVGGLAQVGARRQRVAHQRVAGQGLPLAVDLDRELQPVGEHRVEGEGAADAVGVLQIDDLLDPLVEGERLEAAEVGQEVPVVAGAGQQGHGLLVAERLPPQLEEQHAVEIAGGHLLEAVAVALGGPRPGVGREPEVAVAEQLMELLVDRLVAMEQVDQLRRGRCRPRAAGAPPRSERPRRPPRRGGRRSPPRWARAAARSDPSRRVAPRWW